VLRLGSHSDSGHNYNTNGVFIIQVVVTRAESIKFSTAVTHKLTGLPDLTLGFANHSTGNSARSATAHVLGHMRPGFV
jgi:hypothetical protein